MKKIMVAAAVALIGVFALAKVCIPQSNAAQNVTYQKDAKKPAKKKVAKKKAPKPDYKPYKDPADLRPEGTWKKTSETKKHPDLTQVKNLVIRVSLKGNRTYVLENGKVIYTMLSTGGVYKKGKSVTPTGTFRIEGGRGDSFFNQGLNEGALNWTSWDPNNVYLLHSVPTNASGKINIKEAEKLGKTQGSHGCIRLSIPDSKWLMDELPAGTKVVIKDI